jgi:D-beta-D-heptose 7-phosphate kinase/D-beta-D-heptose 1-phosphate adenosyltransferase
MITIDSPKVDHESRILLLGDLLIDQTIPVEVKKISPEAPVPVVDLIPDKPAIESPGGAGLAASYAVKDNIPILFMTACPKERANWLNDLKIPTSFIRTSDNIKKTRFIDHASNYHLLRVDTDQKVQPLNLNNESTMEIFQLLFIRLLNDYKISIVSMLDYKKGLFRNPTLTQWIIKTCKKQEIPTYVDSRAKDLRKFTGTSLLKLNSSELNLAFGALNVQSPQELIEKLKVQTLLVTKGNEGAEAWTKDGMLASTEIPNHPLGSPDVTGCGDVFDMNFCYHWGTNRAPIKEALTASVNRATGFAYEPIGERTLC